MNMNNDTTNPLAKKHNLYFYIYMYQITKHVVKKLMKWTNVIS